MAGQRIEHRLFVVQFDAVDRAGFRRGDDLGDRRARVVRQVGGRLHPHAVRVPLDNVMDVGKRDAGVFFEHPLGGDAEARRARLDLFGYWRGNLAPACWRHRLARFVQCAVLISDRGFIYMSPSL